MLVWLYLVVIAERVEMLLHDFDVFEGMRAIGAEDGFLMAFAKNEDEIAFFRRLEGEGDGLITV